MLLSYTLDQEEELGLFKLVLDIFEYILIRLDGPGYCNYEQVFIPIMETFLSRCNSVPNMNMQRANIGRQFFVPLGTAAEYLTYYRTRVDNLKRFSFSFGVQATKKL